MSGVGLEQAVTYIEGYRHASGAPTLERMRTLMALLGNPQERLRFVHITGTNGKGSTAMMIAGALCRAGYRTGLTISPHIVEFRERIQIDGALVSAALFEQMVSYVRPHAERIEGLTQFELTTAVAFCCFERAGCEIVVMEVGMGGTRDATNVVGPPLVAAFAQIGLDHTGVLGGTTAEIAREKCGIIKPGTGRVVTCPGQDVDAYAVILEAGMQVSVPVVQPQMGSVEVLEEGPAGSRLLWNGKPLHLPLVGRHQMRNMLTALCVCEQLGALGFVRMLDSEVLREAVERVHVPARLERLCENPLVLVDGAHNPNGAHALAEALALMHDRPMTAIAGMMADKDTAETLALLAPHLDRIVCVRAEDARAMDAEALAALATSLGLRAQAAEGLEQACRQEVARAAREGGGLVVCGSLYVAAEARAVLLPLLREQTGAAKRIG